MKKITQILVAIAALTGAVAAQAATTPTYKSNVLANAKIKNGVLDLTQFNSSMGTLQSVSVELVSSMTSTMNVENKSLSSLSTISGTVSEKLVLSAATGTLVVLQGSVTHSFDEGKFDGAVDFTGASGGSYAPGAQLFKQTNVFSDSATKALFTGTGVVHANLVGTASSVFNGTSGNTASVGLASFNGYANVTYTYALPVPEPETYAMLLAGLGLMGVVARRRKSV